MIDCNKLLYSERFDLKNFNRDDLYEGSIAINLENIKRKNSPKFLPKKITIFSTFSLFLFFLAYTELTVINLILLFLFNSDMGLFGIIYVTVRVLAGQKPLYESKWQNYSQYIINCNLKSNYVLYMTYWVGVAMGHQLYSILFVVTLSSLFSMSYQTLQKKSDVYMHAFGSYCEEDLAKILGVEPGYMIPLFSWYNKYKLLDNKWLRPVVYFNAEYSNERISTFIKIQYDGAGWLKSSLRKDFCETKRKGREKTQD